MSDIQSSAAAEPDPVPEGFGGSDGFADWGAEETAFPTECFPGAAGDMVREIARVATCQNEPLAAVSVLGVLSAVIGASLEVISGPNRKTGANLYLLAVAESGTGKTETFHHAAKPLSAIENAALKCWQDEKEPLLRSSLAILEARMKQLVSRASSAADPGARRELADEVRQAEEERSQVLRDLASRPCIRVGDITKEKFAEIMQGQPGEAVASMSSEARGILAIVEGRYSTSGDVDFYTSGYSGDAITVDRVKNEGRISLTKPCLSVLWMMQPDVVTRAFASQTLTASGLLPRFIIFNSNAEPHQRAVDPDPIAPTTADNWERLIADLHALRHVTEPGLVRASPGAFELFLSYQNENIGRRTSDGDLADLAPFVSRWAENAWRIGLVLHAATHGKESANRELSTETANAAIRLMRWFATAQLAFMGQANRKRFEGRLEALVHNIQTSEDQKKTLRALAKNNGFSNAEVQKLARSYPERILITVEQGPQGGRPSTVVTLTPNPQNRQ